MQYTTVFLKNVKYFIIIAMSEKLNVGIIGTGIGYHVHLPAYQALSAFDVTYICGQNNEKTQKIAEQIYCENFTTDWKELIESPNVDIISIATPPHVHYDMVMYAIENEKHILCEKPLAMNKIQTQKIVEAASESGLINMINLEFRYLPKRAYITELVRSGYLGDIYSININLCTPDRINPIESYYDWWSNKSEGGGMLYNVAPHYIDFILNITGSIDKVLGKLITNINRRINPASGRMKSVSSDDIIKSFMTSDKANISMKLDSTCPFGKGINIELYGNEGAIILDEDGKLLGGKLGEDRNYKKIDLPDNFLIPEFPFRYPLVQPMIQLLRDFERGVRIGRSPHPNFIDGHNIQVIIDAIRQSDKEEKWISTDLKIS